MKRAIPIRPIPRKAPLRRASRTRLDTRRKKIVARLRAGDERNDFTYEPALPNESPAAPHRKRRRSA
jgi:hypothetical protein